MYLLSSASQVYPSITDWILLNCESTYTVLDIGCGYDRAGIDAALVPHVQKLVGIDPSPDVWRNPAIHEKHHTSLEAFADSTEDRFDILFCVMVLEHVEHPNAFFAACHSLLKPGAMFFAITPNLHHYFGFLTVLTTRLHINEWLLDRLVGQTEKETYHFPTRYKANTTKTIEGLAHNAGFASVEVRGFDNWRGYSYVVPHALRWLPRLYSWFIYHRFPLPPGTLLLCCQA